MNDHLIAKRNFFVILIVLILMTGCYKPGPGAEPWKVSGNEDDGAYAATDQGGDSSDPEFSLPGGIAHTPTPNPPIVLPTPRTTTQSYTVQPGDILRKIAEKYQVSISTISTVNEISNPNLIEVGQVLLIPPPSFDDFAPHFKIIPDSELVNSPSNADFDIDGFIQEQNGYLAGYYARVDGVMLSAAEIVERVALEYSVNPRLLLAILEYQSGWVTAKKPDSATLEFPLRYFDGSRYGLYSQLAWASNLLNEGYYLWKINAISVWMLSDGSVIQVDPTINPGTAGVLNLLRFLNNRAEWNQSISEIGVFSTYYNLFGYPFNAALEPMIPADLVQPELQLPFEEGAVWSFTGGPHGGWDTGSAWAAIDFAPPSNASGCVPSGEWVTASAPGEIVYSDHGAVIQDIDGDGVWQTGWSIFYMHIDPIDRVSAGTFLETGERIGHPSCEGGFSTGTHLHIARRYNGEWITADGDLPMVMGGWSSVGYGVEYNGYLVNGDRTLEAYNGRSPLNAIKR